MQCRVGHQLRAPAVRDRRTAVPVCCLPLPPRGLLPVLRSRALGCAPPGSRGRVKPIPAVAAVATLDAQTAVERGAQEQQGFCAVLTTKLSRAHATACTASIVLQDEDGEQLVATSSLDKSLACWRFFTTPDAEERVEVTRLKVPGAPVWSMAKVPTVLPDGTVYKQHRTKPPGIFMGTANKEVVTWMLGSNEVTDKAVLGGHTGWVRSLAVTDKWLFSCGCNFLRMWDTTFKSPKEVKSVKLFTGDILSIAASKGRVYTVGADGSLRSWQITKNGDLAEGPKQEKAHDGRVAACVLNGGAIYTVGYDGCIKAWSADTLELVAAARQAHKGEKVHCVALGANGIIYTGGDDKTIRAWDPMLYPLGQSTEGHGASVRVLAAGKRGLLVSGDAEGDVCIWEVQQPAATLQPARASPLDAAATAAADDWDLALQVHVPPAPTYAADHSSIAAAAAIGLASEAAGLMSPADAVHSAHAAAHPFAAPEALPHTQESNGHSVAARSLEHLDWHANGVAHADPAAPEALPFVPSDLPAASYDSHHALEHVAEEQVMEHTVEQAVEHVVADALALASAVDAEALQHQVGLAPGDGLAAVAPPEVTRAPTGPTVEYMEPASAMAAAAWLDSVAAATEAAAAAADAAAWRDALSAEPSTTTTMAMEHSILPEAAHEDAAVDDVLPHSEQDVPAPVAEVVGSDGADDGGGDVAADA